MRCQDTSEPRIGLAILGIALLGISAACGTPEQKHGPGLNAEEERLNRIAERYVKLVLDLGAHDADFVDAYYGPPEWRDDVPKRGRSVERIVADADALAQELQGIHFGLVDWQRLRYLKKQTHAVRTRAAMLMGETFTFDEECRHLYDAEPPHYDAAHFEAILDELDALLPGDGELIERYAAFRDAYVIPPDRVDAVFRAAIDECRRRTLVCYELPANEDFRVEYVRDKSWSAYNWYKGDAFSLIQVNIDLPITIDRAIDLACHEGYPGHHVYNALLEKTLVRGKGQVEFSVYPLFSPQSLIAEGTANYGIALAFPGEERVRFERDVLFPLAGLDPATAERFYEVWNLTEKLDYAGNEAARGYLDGKWTEEEAIAWLERYALMPRGLAERRVRFFKQYRSYVINYNLGQDLVAAYVERTVAERIGPYGSAMDRWRAFYPLLTNPFVPSGLLEYPLLEDPQRR